MYYFKIQASCLFSLLISMEMSSCVDHLRILDLVRKFATSSSPSWSSGGGGGAGTCDISKSNTPATIGNDPSKIGGGNAGNQANSGNQTSNALAVSGITATNLLISSSGALGANNNQNQANSTGNTLASTNAGLNTDPSIASPIVSMQASQKSNENYKNMIRALDFCYSDDPNAKFTIIDAVNLCVTVVAYAAHAHRANQMLVILDVVIPRYLEHFKTDTDKAIENCKSSGFSMTTSDKTSGNHYQQEIANHARAELSSIQKVSVAIKTLVNNTDFLARTYTGPRMDSTNASHKAASGNKGSTNNRSPSIMPDEDSVRLGGGGAATGGLGTGLAGGGNNAGGGGSTTGGEEKRGRQQQQDVIDEKQMKHEFRSPRDFLLNVVSEFVFFGSKRIKELYKAINDSSIKLGDLLDTKAHCKLVEIAHALLKLWDDSITLNGNGFQQ